MKKVIVLLFLFFIVFNDCNAFEWNLSVGGPALDSNVVFQINSTTKGAIPCPLMTTGQRTGMGTTEGSCAWDATLNHPFWYDGAGWESLIFDDSTATFSNKTIAAGSNTISGLTHGSEVDNPSSGVHGVSGSIVGTTDTQILTNKTISETLDFANTAGTFFVKIKAPDLLSSSYTITQPLNDGNADECYITDGNGVMRFDTCAVAGSVGFNQPDLLSNVGLSIDVSGAVTNAVVISLKQSDGSTDPTGGNPVKIGFRDTTLTTGGFNIRSITASLSWTIDSGATGGTTNGNAHRVYLYLIDDADGAGAIEGAWSLKKFNEAKLQSTTLSDSSADDAYTLYSDTARTTKPIKLIGSFLSTQATAGTWLTAATEVFTGESVNAHNEIIAAVYTTSAGQSIDNAADEIVNFDTKVRDTHGNVTTGGTWAYVVGDGEEGIYTICSFLQYDDSADWDVGEVASHAIWVNGADTRRLFNHELEAAVTTRLGGGNCVELPLQSADSVNIRAFQNSGAVGGIALQAVDGNNSISIRRNNP